MGSSLYIATYSNVDVYECYIEDVPLMRRCSDDWINATQILKAAKFPKAHRTRILEKEVQIDVHEKIQGGYGRFQGTWIPLNMARNLAHRYNITDDMAPILSYVPDPNNPLERKTKPKTSNVSATDVGSPTKKPKRIYNTKKRRAAAAAQAAAVQAELERKNSNSRQSGVTQLPPIISDRQYDSQVFWQRNLPTNEPPKHTFQTHQFPPIGLQQTPFRQSIPIQQQPYAYQPQQNFTTSTPNLQLHQPLVQQPQQSFIPHHQQSTAFQQHKSHRENWSQDDGSLSTQMDETMRDSDTSVSSSPSSSNETSKSGKVMYTEQLIEFFSKESDKVPLVLMNPPSDFDFNEPIDDEGHTPLHWASAMANVALVELLLKHGSDPLTANSMGMNCISRAVTFNNSASKQNFHILVDLMKNCLYTPDKSGRTPLHYISDTNRNRNQTSFYYLQTILGKLAQGNQNLLKIVVNHKDIRGDTALDLAQRWENDEIINLLFKYGATGETDQTGDTGLLLKEEHEVGTPNVLGAPSVPTLPLDEAGPILTSMLGSLADAYDSELKSKEEETEHTEEVLDSLNVDINATKEQNKEILEQIGGADSLEEVEKTIARLETDSRSKTEYLTRVLERGQALDLAKLVHKEESSIDSINNNLNELDLAIELTKLQSNRTKLIQKIIDEITNHNINAKMNSYRKLISISCGLRVESIDNLIDEIEADLFTTVGHASA